MKIIDCDVHVRWRQLDDLAMHLAEPWRRCSGCSPRAGSLDDGWRASACSPRSHAR